MKIDEYDSFESFSWEILGDSIAIKTIDKSVFESRRTGIPQDIRYFWEVDDLAVGASKDITILWGKTEYIFTIEKESYREPYRTKMKWKASFANALSEAIPPNIRDYKENVCRMRFEKEKEDYYVLSIMYPCPVVLDESEEDSISLLEGETIESLTKTYKRNQKNRENAIKIHGTVCYCCGFSFVDFYGERGNGYIEVHHVVPLGERKSVQETNPETDLVPLCSNCHRMIHRSKPAMDIEELKRIVENTRQRYK